MKGRYLWETRPDIFPEGYETPLEQSLWGIHYEEKDKRAKANEANAKAKAR